MQRSTNLMTASLVGLLAVGCAGRDYHTDPSGAGGSGNGSGGSGNTTGGPDGGVLVLNTTLAAADPCTQQRAGPA